MRRLLLILLLFGCIFLSPVSALIATYTCDDLGSSSSMNYFKCDYTYGDDDFWVCDNWKYTHLENMHAEAGTPDEGEATFTCTRSAITFYTGTINVEHIAGAYYDVTFTMVTHPNSMESGSYWWCTIETSNNFDDINWGVSSAACMPMTGVIGFASYTHAYSGSSGPSGVHRDYIGEYPTPVADFTSNVTNVPVGGNVLFTDLSTNTPTSWQWLDNGVEFSTDQNPVYDALVYGWHNISFYAQNDAGSDWENKTHYLWIESEACGYLPTASISGTANPITGTAYNYYLITNMLSSGNVSVTWGFTDGYNVYSPKNLYNYQKIDGDWFQYNETSFAYDIAVTESDVTTQSITFYLTSEQYAEHEAYVRVMDSDCTLSDIDSMDLTVSGSAYQHNLPIMVYDVSNGNLINNFNLNVHDYTAGTWANYTGINSNMLIPVDLYHNIALIVTKSGYDLCDHGYPDNECSRYYIYPDNPVSLNVYLNAACGAPAGQSCEHISVQWGYGSDWGVGTPIAGASVTVNGTTYSTNSAGLVNIYLENDTSFGVTISRASFQTVYENLTSGAEGVHHWNYYELVPLSLITPTVTIPTTAMTSIPITQPPHGASLSDESRYATKEAIRQGAELVPTLFILFLLLLLISAVKKV